MFLKLPGENLVISKALILDMCYGKCSLDDDPEQDYSLILNVMDSEVGVYPIINGRYNDRESWVKDVRYILDQLGLKNVEITDS